MNILLTGASGFVGQNLQRYPQLKKTGVFPVSLRDSHWKERFTQKADALIHLAGKAHDTENEVDADAYFEINTELTKQVFEQFLQSEMGDFIYFSSVKAVADTVTGVLDEDVAANPKTPYGQSKYMAERYLQSKGLPAGKRVFILRPCMIHGPGNKGNLNLLYNVVKKGIPYPLAAFENKRSFLSIKNLLFIITQLLKTPDVPGGVYNVADDDPLTTSEVIRIMGQVNGVKPRLWSVSPSLIRTVAKVGDNFRLPLNSERLKKLTESYVVSNQKIKNILRIQALPVSSKNGLIETIKSFSE